MHRSPWPLKPRNKTLTTIRRSWPILLPVLLWLYGTGAIAVADEGNGGRPEEPNAEPTVQLPTCGELYDHMAVLTEKHIVAAQVQAGSTTEEARKAAAVFLSDVDREEWVEGCERNNWDRLCMLRSGDLTGFSDCAGVREIRREPPAQREVPQESEQPPDCAQMYDHLARIAVAEVRARFKEQLEEAQEQRRLTIREQQAQGISRLTSALDELKRVMTPICEQHRDRIDLECLLRARSSDQVDGCAGSQLIVPSARPQPEE